MPADIPIHKGNHDKFQVLRSRQVEQDYIEKVLRKTSGNKTQAAEMLGISLWNSYRKLDQYKRPAN
jgi:transcriptional regulator with PAS, ATPase and Fis domain